MRFQNVDSVLEKAIIVDADDWIPAESADSINLTLKRHRHEATAKERIALEGSTDRLSLSAKNFGPGVSGPAPFRYAVAIVPADASAPVRVWDAELLISERHVKRTAEVEASDPARLGLKDGKVATSAASAAVDYKTAQNLLGEAFGTRKRKQTIASLEKNRVKVDGMGDASASYISSNLTVEAASETAKSMIEAANSASTAPVALLPAFDAETGDVAGIYRVADLIPKEVYRALPVEDFTDLSSEEAVKACQARYMIKGFWMDRIRTAPKTDGNHRLRLLLFSHFLASFRDLREAALNGPNGSVAALQERLPGCPAVVAADLLARFADAVVPSAGGSNVASFVGKTKYKLPPMMRDKAVIFTLILLLHVDSFRLNATALSDALTMPPSKLVTFCRAVGCSLDKPANGEDAVVRVGERLLPAKFARLTAPLKFPAPPKKQGGGR